MHVHEHLLDKLIKERKFLRMTFFDMQSLRTRGLYMRKLLEIIVKKIRLPVPYKSLDPLNEPVIGERAKRARHSHVCSIENRGYIGECGSTLYVGLSGIVWNLIQKSTG